MLAVADAMEAQCATHEGRKAHARDVCDQAKREIAALDAAIGSATI